MFAHWFDQRSIEVHALGISLVLSSWVHHGTRAPAARLQVITWSRVTQWRSVLVLHDLSPPICLSP